MARQCRLGRLLPMLQPARVANAVCLMALAALAAAKAPAQESAAPANTAGAAVVQAEAGDVQSLRIEPAQFVAVRGGSQYVIKLGGLGALCMRQGSGQFVASLQLASDLHVTGIRASFDDDSPDAFGLLALFRIEDSQRHLMLITDMSADQQGGEVAARLDTPEPVRGTARYILQATLTGRGVCLRQAQVDLR